MLDDAPSCASHINAIREDFNRFSMRVEQHREVLEQCLQHMIVFLDKFDVSNKRGSNLVLREDAAFGTLLYDSKRTAIELESKTHELEEVKKELETLKERNKARENRSWTQRSF